MTDQQMEHLRQIKNEAETYMCLMTGAKQLEKMVRDLCDELAESWNAIECLKEQVKEL